jgi:hypothetical protein
MNSNQELTARGSEGTGQREALLRRGESAGLRVALWMMASGLGSIMGVVVALCSR